MTKPNAQVVSDAQNWARLLESERLDDATFIEFQDWLEADPTHRRAFATAQALWDKTELSLSELAQLRTELENDKSGIPRVFETFGSIPRPAFAAAVLVFFVFVGTVILEPGGPELTTVATAVGEQAEVKLPDGSSIKLNTNTRLTYGVNGAMRLVALESGEAFFDVAPDPNRPFVVEINHRRVTVLGTKFNVRFSEEGLRVALVEGRLALSEKTLAHRLGLSEQTVLDPGEAAISFKDGPISLGRFDEQRVTAWQDGAIIFREQTLGEILKELSRYHEVDLSPPTNASSTRRYSGIVYFDDLDLALKQLSSLASIRMEPNDGNGLENRQNRP